MLNIKFRLFNYTNLEHLKTTINQKHNNTQPNKSIRLLVFNNIYISKNY